MSSCVGMLTGQSACEHFLSQAATTTEKAVTVIMEKAGYDSKAIFEKLDRYIKNIRYGSIVVVIQDGKIVQIEKNEKERFV